jgi:hypothetical protein
MIHSIWYWFAILLSGTGAVLTKTPTNLPIGETILHAPKVLKPVDDSMRVQIDLGKVTEEKKKQVISGPFCAAWCSSRRLSRTSQLSRHCRDN